MLARNKPQMFVPHLEVEEGRQGGEGGEQIRDFYKEGGLMSEPQSRLAKCAVKDRRKTTGYRAGVQVGSAKNEHGRKAREFFKFKTSPLRGHDVWPRILRSSTCIRMGIQRTTFKTDSDEIQISGLAGMASGTPCPRQDGRERMQLSRRWRSDDGEARNLSCCWRAGRNDWVTSSRC